MAYEFITKFNAPKFTRGSVAGRKKPTEGVVHWWGNPVGATLDGIVDWFTNPARGAQTSAHYVVEAGRVACLVDPADVAWHAGDWAVNVRSIGLELNPRQSDGDYATAAELIARLRSIYGDFPLSPHRQHIATQCPGTYDLARLDREARAVVLDQRPPAVQPPVAPVVTVTPTGPVPQQPIAPVNRYVTAPTATVRLAPNDKAGIFAVYPTGTPIAVIGYVSGQDPYRTGDNAWFKTRSGYYVWCNTVSNNISGLPWLGQM